MANRALHTNYSVYTETDSLISRMSNQPTLNRKNLIDCTIYQLKSAGIWDELDAIWFMAAHDSQTAKLNWKSSSYNLTELGTMNFVEDRGYTRNGAAGGTVDALNTNFTPSINGVKFTRNSNSFGVYTRTNVFEATGDFGNLLAGNLGIQLNVWSSSTQGAARDNDGAAMIFSSTSGLGLSSIIRPASNIYHYYKNGNFVRSLANTASGNTNIPLYICALNYYLTGIAFGSTKQSAFAYVGSGNIDQVKLYSIVQFYMNGVGAAV